MAKNIFYFIIFSLLLLCCQQSTDINDFPDFPENGNSSIIIDNIQYSGSAYLSTLTTEHFNFKSIVLAIDDSTKIEILRKSFEEGTYSCTPTQSIVFTLTSNDRSIYSAEEGILSLKKVKPDQIIGEFDIVVRDATSSCANCPDDIIKVVGKFNAIKL